MANLIAFAQIDDIATQVETRHHPAYQGIPFAVTNKSGTIITAVTPEARRYGINPGLPHRTAHQRCPGLRTRPEDDTTIATEHQRFLALLETVAENVEEHGTGSAYLHTPHQQDDDLEAFSQEIRRTLYRELRLTSSIGIGPTRFIAKAGARVAAPNDILLVTTNTDATALLDGLPIEAFDGVGPKAAEKLRSHGIRNGQHLRHAHSRTLHDLVGQLGYDLYAHVRHAEPKTMRNQGIMTPAATPLFPTD